MPSPRPEALALAQRYALALTSARRGLAGEQLGRGTGGSLEFEDRRQWRVGDDVRRIDWNALGRTDQLLVRLYREEIAPRVEILLDVSRSLAVEPEKAQLAVDLAGLLALSAQCGGYQVALIACGARSEPLELSRFLAQGVECSSELSLAPGFEGLLRPGALRIVLSDFLIAGELSGRLRAIAARAGGLGFVQVLARFDLEPPRGEALRLTDSESGAELDLVLDRGALAGYQKRLQRLQAELEREAQRLHAPFGRLVAGTQLSELCARELVPVGILQPR